MTKITLPKNFIYIGLSKKFKTRGVFAGKNIKKGEIFEICPVILVPYKTKRESLGYSPTKSILDNYYFSWNNKFWAWPAGYGVLYNHSYIPNANYFRDIKKKVIKFKALKTINKNEEILINYNGSPDDKTPIEKWFKEVNGKAIL